MKLLSLKLRQHTPLIHFQGEQFFATLRASEVKPRLDKYIIDKEFHNDFDQCGHLLVGFDPNRPNDLRERFNSGYRALNYKMRIYAEDEGETSVINNSPMYFGNMGDGNAKVFTMRETNILEIRIPQQCLQLYDIILSHIGTMFMHTNFGTRKTKGYGSFTVFSTDGTPVQTIRPKLYFDSAEGDFRNVLNEIEYIHKALRSGINDCGQKQKKLYFKSLMFAYAKSKGRQWDKRSIKQQFLGSSQQANHGDSDIVSFSSRPPHYDYRDCLGLSTDESWRNYVMNIKKSSDTVERFMSPILFKPVKTDSGWRVYLVYNELPDAFKEATIKIKSTRQHNTLKLNIDPEFSIQDYIDFVFQMDKNGDYAIDIEDLFSPETSDYNHKKKDRILEIFSELRNNYNQ